MSIYTLNVAGRALADHDYKKLDDGDDDGNSTITRTLRIRAPARHSASWFWEFVMGPAVWISALGHLVGEAWTRACVAPNTSHTHAHGQPPLATRSQWASAGRVGKSLWTICMSGYAARFRRSCAGADSLNQGPWPSNPLSQISCSCVDLSSI